MRRLINLFLFCLFVFLSSMSPQLAYANLEVTDKSLTVDRIQLVTQQINLLKDRLSQSQYDLAGLQQERDKQTQLTIEKVSKNLLDKVSLDVAVAKSNLDSIQIELTDSQQTTSWIEKNIQEIENQFNVVSMFGLKIAKNEMNNMQDLRTDLAYQKELLVLEKTRLQYLQNLQKSANQVWQLKKDKYNRINASLKSQKMLLLKQQQMHDELRHQEEQNKWLQQLNGLYAQLAKLDPSKDRRLYYQVERDIFYANENANFAYIQSLVARYEDQIQ
ncbi:MAG TPA: hypothetical protein VHZ76_01640, partial [Gammaproteobacteria bacterium]|nr:hypothetical protein [Gammaproteobacteria bacterium]